MDRRSFVKITGAAGAGALLGRKALAAPPTLLAPSAVPKFVNLLPIPSRVDATRGGNFVIQAGESRQNLLGITSGALKGYRSRVWGYGLAGRTPTYPGPTLVTSRDCAINVEWQNKLYNGHFLPVDPTLHWALGHMPGMWNQDTMKPVPLITHLHGGHTESASDGGPEQWYTPDFAMTGPEFVKRALRYDNDQESATLWYHDHALGITRLNVYAGLAGFYFLRDSNENNLIGRGALPCGAREIEIVIQDRQFTAAGELYFPSTPAPGTTAPEPSALPEFFGDIVLVNGVAWPKLNVDQGKYRFRLLNGSDSRFYRMRLVRSGGSNLAFQQIGTDDGFLAQPVTLGELVFGPGERADIVVDFKGLRAGETVTLTNDAPTPFPDGDPVAAGSGASVLMRFDVGSKTVSNDVSLPSSLRQTRFLAPGVTSAVRKLLLFEGRDSFGRIQPLLGVVNGTTGIRKLWDDPITETPTLGTTEVWEFYNSTMDAHPIHLHAVSFEVVSRQPITFTPYDPTSPTAKVTNIGTMGAARGPDANEMGPKDTVRSMPGEVTRVKARFDRPGLYVWHCHILSHEDNEMMRPQLVVCNPSVALGAARGFGFLGLDGSKWSIKGPGAGVDGDAGVCGGASVKLDKGSITGTLYLDSNGDVSKDGTDIGGGTVSRSLAQANSDAVRAWQATSALTKGRDLGDLKSSVVVQASPGLNVIQIGDIDLKDGESLTLKGTVNDEFIVNVRGKKMKLKKNSVVLLGGVLPSKVLFNLCDEKADLSIESGSSVMGTILMRDGKVKVNDGCSIIGALISGGKVDLSGQARIRYLNGF